MMHAWRTLVGTLSPGAWFYAIAYLPQQGPLLVTVTDSIAAGPESFAS